MRLPSSIFIALALVAGSASTVLGQTGLRLESGARVRLVTPSLPAGQQIVRIESTMNDTVVFRSEQNPVSRRLALSEITAADLSLGQRRRTARGAGIGLASGVVLGAIAGYATYEPCEGWCIFGPATRGGSVALGATAGGVLGLVTGTAIGFFTRSEKWQRVHTQTTVSVFPSPAGGSLAVSRMF